MMPAMPNGLRHRVRHPAMCAAMLGALGGSLPTESDAATLSVNVVDKAGMPVADAAVFAMPVNAKAALKPNRAAIDQVNKEFVPLVSVMSVGTSVNFPNHDNIRHHVYSFSPAKAFELKLYSGQPAQPITFDKPGIVVLGCNIHDWMVSYVVVVDTPYYAKTDAMGRAQLEGLPNGDYDLKLWHYRASTFNETTAERRLSVAANATAAFAIELKAKPLTGPSSK